ncbi:MAG: hypothetical protein E6G08_16765 [Actinobacteria bacterium]|nr:MAG: hypothetical protein E6G08_16765 [Actinomycetota bacterium]
MRSHARTRLDNAEKSLEVAELAAAEEEIPASRNVAAAVAVLSGIASAEAACCAALGRRSRGDDHREAAALLRQIVDRERAAKAVLELINLKDTAQYGLVPITKRELTTTLRRARILLDFAREVLRR